MDTYFAPATTSSEEEFPTEIEIVNSNPIISGLLNSMNGLLAVLNEHRQVLALNDELLKMLGIDNALEVLGLRPGNILNCIHANEEPAGCGTTKFCSSCGAAIAIVSSIKQNKPVEKLCAMTCIRNGCDVDIVLNVRSQPLVLDKRKFLLLFLQDVTQHQERAALERTFFHDINNILNMLVGTSELLIRDNPSKLAKNLHRACQRLVREVAIQRCLSQSEACTYQPVWTHLNTKDIFVELSEFFSNHPVSQGKDLQLPAQVSDHSIFVDSSLLLRILSNMIINAFEATADHGRIKVWLDKTEDALSFHVWNDQKIPDKMIHRIFQRNFSTKAQAGRGIGTYSMKLLGEKILRGKVSFRTSREEGTTFTYAYPLEVSED